jgi:phage baseplate assembly protein V
MLPFEEVNKRLTALEGALNQIVRTAFVTEVFPEEGKVRVEIRDADMIETFKLPVLVHKTRCDKDYWMPDRGEMVVCVFLPHGLQIGFVVGAFYNEKDLVPVKDRNKRHVRFEDGAWFEYDRAAGVMQVHVPETIILAAGVAVEIRTPVLKAPVPTPATGGPELQPVEPSPLPSPLEWPYG